MRLMTWRALSISPWCEEKYNKSKMVHSILRHVAETTTTSLEDLYEYMAGLGDSPCHPVGIIRLFDHGVPVHIRRLLLSVSSVRVMLAMSFVTS